MSEWLKRDFELGHGHAMAIYAVLKTSNQPKVNKDEAVDKHFSGNKVSWRTVFDKLIIKLKDFGDDIRVDLNDCYLSILRGDKSLQLCR